MTRWRQVNEMEVEKNDEPAAGGQVFPETSLTPSAADGIFEI